MAVINGKKVDLVLDLGAVKVINKVTGKNFFKLKADEYEDIEVMAGMIYGCAVRGNKDITMEDVDALKFDEVMGLMEEIMSEMEDFMPEKSDSPLAGKPKPRR